MTWSGISNWFLWMWIFSNDLVFLGMWKESEIEILGMTLLRFPEDLLCWLVEPCLDISWLKHFGSIQISRTKIVNRLFKLRLGASIGRFVCRMVGRSFRLSKKIWTTPMVPRELIFGVQLAVNLTKWNIKKNIGKFWGLLPNLNCKVFFIAISRIRQDRRLIFGMQPDYTLTWINIEKQVGTVLRLSSKSQI